MAQPCCWAAGLIQIEVLQAKPQKKWLGSNKGFTRQSTAPEICINTFAALKL